MLYLAFLFFYLKKNMNRFFYICWHLDIDCWQNSYFLIILRCIFCHGELLVTRKLCQRCNLLRACIISWSAKGVSIVSQDDS